MSKEPLISKPYRTPTSERMGRFVDNHIGCILPGLFLGGMFVLGGGVTIGVDQLFVHSQNPWYIDGIMGGAITDIFAIVGTMVAGASGSLDR